MTDPQLSDLKLRLNIIDVIGRRIPLKRKGKEHVGYCPFHNEKSPSFTVSFTKQIYKCFGCGVSGDSIAFVQAYERKDFKEAIEMLAAEVGMNIESGTHIPVRWDPIPRQAPERTAKVIDPALVRRSMQKYEQQPLFRWFCERFGYHAALSVFQMYYVGTASKRKDGTDLAPDEYGTIFWQLDYNGNPAMAQMIRYKGFNRDKDVPPIRLYKQDDGYAGCFFGEHLLGLVHRSGVQPLVCIVESEKSAMICSMYLPTMDTARGERECVWLASVGSNGMTDEKIRVLAGCDVVLFPDFKWMNRVQWGLVPMERGEDGKPLEGGAVDESYKSVKDRILAAGAAHVNVFDTCPGRVDGGDIADHLIGEARRVAYDRWKRPSVVNRMLVFGMPGHTEWLVGRMREEWPLVGELMDRLNLVCEKVERATETYPAA